MICFLSLVIFGALFQDANAESSKRELFNELFKSDSSFFKIQKSPKYSSKDFWICADGGQVLLTDILKGNVSYTFAISIGAL